MKPKRLRSLASPRFYRIELMMALEDWAGRRWVPAKRARLVNCRRLQPGPCPKRIAFPRWSRRSAVRLLRDVSQHTWILPLAQPRPAAGWKGRATAVSHTRSCSPPEPLRTRRCSLLHFPAGGVFAIAMWKEYFDAHFRRRGPALSPSRAHGARSTISSLASTPAWRAADPAAGELVTKGFSILSPAARSMRFSLESG